MLQQPSRHDGRGARRAARASRNGRPAGTSGSSGRPASRSSRRGARTAATGSAGGRGCPRSCSPQAEALGLVMAVLDGRPAAGRRRRPGRSALGKVVRALPEQRRAAGRGAARARVGRARPALGPPRPGHDERAGRGRRRAATGAVALPQRVRQRVGGGGGPVGGRGAPRPVVPAVPLPPRGRDAHLPDRPGRRASGRPPEGFEPPDGPGPGGACWRRTWAPGGSSPPASCSTPRWPRWRPGSGRRWVASSPSGDGCVLVGSTEQPDDVRRRVAGRRAVRLHRRGRAGAAGRRRPRLAARFAAAVPATSPT